MKFILPIVLLGFLTACGQSVEEKQKEQTQKEWEKRNDTSNYPTNIGHNKTY